MLKETKWSQKEEEILKRFARKQRGKNYINWEKVANAINYALRTEKTAGQCRQRFGNYARLSQNNDYPNKNWSQAQKEIFFKLYLEKGSSWSYISTILTNKSQNCLKNQFASSLKNAAEFLYMKKKKMHQINNCAEMKNLIILLRFSDNIMGCVQNLGLQINKESLLFKFRSEIIRLCFKPYLFNLQNLHQLRELIDTINIKYQNCAVFYSSNKSTLKTRQALQQICQFDNIILKNSNVKVEQQPVPQKELKVKTQVCVDNLKNMIKIKKQQQQQAIIPYLNQDFYRGHDYFLYYEHSFYFHHVKKEE